MKIKTLLLTAIAAAALSVTCLAQGITVTLNGNTISFPNQQPTVVEGRTLIPLRGVFDNMGYSIDWNGTTKTVTLTKNSDKIVINIGENCYYLNGVSNTIDVPAQIINGSTMLPLRAIADASGCQVNWDSNTKTAAIVYSGSVSSSSNTQTTTAKSTTSTTETTNQASTQTYILNTNTKKFHKSDCPSANRIKDENKQEYKGNRQDVINMGYDPCQNCNP